MSDFQDGNLENVILNLILISKNRFFITTLCGQMINEKFHERMMQSEKLCQIFYMMVF